MSLVASDFTSVSRFDNGASTRPLPSLPGRQNRAGRRERLVQQRHDVGVGVDESAWIFATGDGADALPLSAVTLPRVRNHSPGNPVSVGAICATSSSSTLPSFNCEIGGVLSCRMPTKPNLAGLWTFSPTA